jgi:hypothetical protein
MKAYWISALLLVTCASAVTGLSNSSVYGSADSARDRLVILRNTSDPFVLAASARRGWAEAVLPAPASNDLFPHYRVESKSSPVKRGL